MGIQGLSKVLGDNAPSSVRENDIKNYFGKTKTKSKTKSKSKEICRKILI